MNKRIAIAFTVIALIVTTIVVVYLLEQRIPMNSTDSGNTSGNLQNGGLVFEMDGKVYFANPSDYYCLYSMNLDESKPKRLTSMGVRYINGANGLLYFYMDSSRPKKDISGLGGVTNQYGIYRCKENGRNQTCLVREMVGELQLCGEYIYYQVKTGGGSLQKIRVDKSHQSVVIPEFISPVCYSNGVIYYSGPTKDHNIHALHTDGGDYSSDVISGNFFFPVIQDGFLYYLNGDSNYSLWRTNLMTGQQELITSDRVDCYTLNNQNIYYSYSNAKDPSLKRCNLDGSNQVVLYPGIVNSINLTSKFVYFKVYGSDDQLYHMPLDGSAPASILEVKEK